MENVYEFGTWEAFVFDPTTEQIEMAKEKIVNWLCDEIRRVSKEYPNEFFIVKDTRHFPLDTSVLTIGAKLIAPTLSIKE